MQQPAIFDLPEPGSAEPSPGATAEHTPIHTAEHTPIHTAEPTPVRTAERTTVPAKEPPPIAARVLVATDGSCLANPGGPTGWAYVRDDGRWACAGRPVGTNQIGELLALTDHPNVELEIQCDSAYAIGSATTWKPGWQRNNYVNSQKKTVSNLEIIRTLHRLIDDRTAPVTFTKVKGHDLSNRWPLNTAVDVVCGRAAVASGASGQPFRDSGVMQIDWEPRVSRRAARA
jgi:ribonuclease HI